MNKTAKSIVSESVPMIVSVAHNLQKEDLSEDDLRTARDDLRSVISLLHSASTLSNLPDR
jgi:hypothetical protein